jgi:acetolactate synthase I/II/III large subunit
MVEYPPQLWNMRGDKPNIHIDFTPAEIDAYYNPELELIGDIAGALELLTQRIQVAGIPAIDIESQQRTRQRLLADFARYKDDDTDGTIRPQKALWDVRQSLGPRDILLSGVGAHKMWVGRYYHCHEPNTCLISNGLCAMGMPLPGAIAAHLVHPDRKIFIVAGDGDFLMNVHEMETAKRLGSRFTAMIWEDKDYGLITWKQKTQHGHHVDMTFGNPNWQQLADAFGWQCQIVRRSRDLRGAIDRGLDYEDPSLIIVPIDYRENELLTARLGEITGKI